MKEKIYNILCVLNIALSIVAFWFFFENYLLYWIWLILFIMVVRYINKNKNKGINKYLSIALTCFNVIVCFVNPISFYYFPLLWCLIFLIYFLLPIFLPYEKLTNKQLNWNFYILCFLLILIGAIFYYYWKMHTFMLINIIITLWISLIFFLKRKSLWIISFHLIITILFIYQTKDYFFKEALRADPTTANFLLIAIYIMYIIMSLHFILSTFSLIFVNLSKKKELIEK